MNPIPNDDRRTDHGQATDVRGTRASGSRTPTDDHTPARIPATGGEDE